MAIEIVDLPIKNGGSFHSYVSLPEGNPGLTHDDLGLLEVDFREEMFGTRRHPTIFDDWNRR